MEITIGQNPELIKKAQFIRHQVFTLEQQIPKTLELDGADDVSFHALITAQSDPVATARLTINSDGSSKMSRISVTKEYRGIGLAAKVVQSLMQYAKDIGVCSIDIHAHQYLRNYYERIGFSFIQEIDPVGEHPLIEMRYSIVRT